MMLLILLVAAFSASAFFLSVKTVFSKLWKDAPLELQQQQQRVLSKIVSLEKTAEDVRLTVDFGRLFFSALFILVLMALLRKAGVYESGLSLHAGLSFLFAVLLLSFFGQLLPRAVCRVFADRLMTPFYYGYLASETLFWPAIAVFKSVKALVYRMLRFEEQLSFLSSNERDKINGGESGQSSLNRDEKEMIHSILEFRKTEVSEILVPRTETIAVDEDANVSDIISIINQYGHSRIPVYRGNIDDIIGILNVKDLYKSFQRECNAFDAGFRIASIVRPAYFVPQNKKINELFQELKKEKVHLAVVVDEYGGTSGIVTFEDILEEIVGEIQDEYDHDEELFKRIDNKTIELDPKIGIEDFNRILNLSLNSDSDDYKTLSGLIMTHAGSIPEVNAEYELHGLKVKILKMDGRRIARVRVALEQEDPPKPL